MNIVWLKDDGGIAVTSILNGDDPKDHADLLKQRGDIEPLWYPVLYNYDNLPDTPQETWSYNGIDIITDETKIRAYKYRIPISAYQFKAAVNNAQLRDNIELYILSSDYDLKDYWNHKPFYHRDDKEILAIQSACKKYDFDQLFDLAKEL